MSEHPDTSGGLLAHEGGMAIPVIIDNNNNFEDTPALPAAATTTGPAAAITAAETNATTAVQNQNHGDNTAQVGGQENHGNNTVGDERQNANDDASTNNNSTTNSSTTGGTGAKRKGSKNAGSKKGGKRVERPQSFWYRLCQVFDRGTYKSQIEFLRSPDSGDDVGAQQRMHFSRAYKKYQNGTLGNCEESRCRKRKYEPLEQRVIQYWTEQQQLLNEEEEQEKQQEQPPPPMNVNLIQHQQHQQQHPHEQNLFYDGTPATAFPTAQEFANFNTNATKKRKTSHTANGNGNKKGKSPLAWSILQQKAKEWAKEMGLDDGFQASAGWLDNVLKRHQREMEARKTRVSLVDGDVTLRRNQGAQYEQRKAVLEHQLQRADQLALLETKGLQVGDRVTVLDVSQQQPGDLVITQVHQPINKNDGNEELKPAAEGTPKASKSKANNTNKSSTSPKESEQHLLKEDVIYVTVERKRHGSTQSFPIHDVRRVVKHMAQEEDTVTMQQLLQPDTGMDPFMTAMAHFPKASLPFSRALRPVWEGMIDDHNNQQHNKPTMNTTTMRLQVSDTSCAEKINVQALRSHILPMFRRDQKNRTNLLEELQAMSQRTPLQQTVLEKLQYAQMTHDMAKDLLELIGDVPTKDKTVVYQVDYLALDASQRGRLFAQHPAPPLNDNHNTKTYAPRPLTLQAMPQDLRNALVGSFAHWITCSDHDILVSILCSLAELAQASNLIPSWLDYRQHATSWCDFIRQIHNGVSPTQARLLPQIILQGGTYETWKQAMDEQTAMALPSPTDEGWKSLQTFVLRLTTEWRALRDVVLALPQYSWVQLDKAALLASHEYAPAAIPNICMVRIMQACEKDVWAIVGRTVQAQGWIVRAKLFDGLLVEAPSLTDSFSTLLSLAENAVKSRGWDVGLMEGECYGKFSGHHKAPLALLQEARRAMEELQEETEPTSLIAAHEDGHQGQQPPVPTVQQDADQREGNRIDHQAWANTADNTPNEELVTRTANADLQLFVQL